MSMWPAFVVGLAFSVSLLWSACGIVALWRVRGRARMPLRRATTPVSVLKPLAGCDDALEENLRSFFEQDYPSYEIVFGVQDRNDPALQLARKLKAEYPHVASRIVVHEQQGMNPKVSNLRAMLSAVRCDLLAISDSNVAVQPHWLGELVGELEQPGVGLVFNLIAGVGEQSLGAALENLQLQGPVAAGMVIPTELFDHPAVVGKSMLLQRSQFQSLGGFESVASVLAEDYVIGRMIHTAGLRVRIAPTPVYNVNRATTLRGFVARQLRWAMLRVRLQPLAYAFEPLTQPWLVAMLATLSGHASPALIWFGLSIALLRDAVQGWLLRGDASVLRTLPLIPLRDLLVLAAWIAAPFCKHVRWRGHRLRLSAGTRLYAERLSRDSNFIRVES